jgi:hypothetical protein
MREFIRDYPRMAIRPRTGKPPLLKGRFEFHARHPEIGEIEDAFDLEIELPENFPRELPTVIETGQRIPRTPAYHVNSSDGSLCLGSPLRLLLIISKKPTVTGFAELCLVPYLVAVSHKLQTGAPLLFGELDHGVPGALSDYQGLFNLDTPAQALDTVHALGKKKRVANKLPCPCGCQRRLGKCNFRDRLNSFRALATRSWYRYEFQQLTRPFRMAPLTR